MDKTAGGLLYRYYLSAVYPPSYAFWLVPLGFFSELSASRIFPPLGVGVFHIIDDDRNYHPPIFGTMKTLI